MSGPSNVLALIPARSGSQGIPNKNFRNLGGCTPVELAVSCAARTGIRWRLVTTDAWPVPGTWLARNVPDDHFEFRPNVSETRFLRRPSELAQDDTPMLAVVQHALKQISGPPEQIIVLLQPTQPLRQPAHVTAAIALLRETQADSVVSVVTTESPDKLCRIREDGRLMTWNGDWWVDRRQDCRPAVRRDGTVYAFWRKTVTEYRQIYGQDVRSLQIPASETCALDTLEDWAEAERRLSQNCDIP